MQNSNTLNQGWVFSPKLDLTLFALPVFLIIGITLLNFGNTFQLNSWAGVLMVKIPFDFGHVVLTVLPMKNYIRLQDIRTQKLLFSFLVVTALALALFLIAKPWFYVMLPSITFYHIWKQQYGWVMWSRNKSANDPTPKLVDKLMIWNLMLFPFAWWQSEANTLPKGLYFENDLVLNLPAAFVNSWHVLFIVSTCAYAVYLGYLIYSGRLKNYGKLVLLISTLVWGYGALIISQSRTAYLVTLSVVHGLPYFHLAAKNYFVGRDKLGSFQGVSPAKIFGILAVLCLFWYWCSSVVNQHTLRGEAIPWLEFLIWMPLILHYVYDSFIWKGRRKLLGFNIKNI